MSDALRHLKNACIEAIYHAEQGHIDHAKSYLEQALGQIPDLWAQALNEKTPVRAGVELNRH